MKRADALLQPPVWPFTLTPLNSLAHSWTAPTGVRSVTTCQTDQVLEKCLGEWVAVWG